VGALWFLLNFATLAADAAEVGVARWQLGVVLALDALLWVALTPLLFYLYDRTPVVRGRRLLSLLLRAVIAVTVGFFQSRVIWAIGVPTALAVGIPEGVIAPPYVDRQELFFDAIFFALIALAAHVWLRRAIIARLAAERALGLEGKLATARLHALSTELQPHFLFNTLNGIAALIPSDPEQAEVMLLNLSDLLRHTLDSGGTDGIPLRREMERLDLYLDIQRMRLGSRLQVVRSLDPDAMEARVPSMVLQPLVENAIRHGIEPRPGPGTLRLTAERRGTRLRIDVTDDGLGAPPPDRLKEGIGLANTRARIEAMFEDGSLTVHPGDDGGTVVRVEVPFDPVASQAPQRVRELEIPA